ncbi:Argonaute complex, subunit Arb1 [Lasiosphaeria ovina]|uniref:Argonaute complex, subunit Arb1 n=1 Tax=Lasiosphaeria ovina TaxID=92902 RepID=A0AAE0KMG0_9PEZI|nr:Argonaute complex, subunit Arb1 [Lasiosphaeria ovina]
MSSLPYTVTASAVEAQEDVTPREPSPQLTNGEIPVQDDKKDEKKKKKRSGRSGAKKRGTGFEEFYCDPPMTPDEYDQEKNVIYPPHRPFVDRIEEAIQRFRARRRMDSARDILFSRYLFLGGIDTTVRQFQSTRNLDHDTLDEATKADVREMTADDVIHRGGGASYNPRFYNPNYPEHWDVDFAGVAAGFLSEQLVKFAGPAIDDYGMGVEVVSHFLKYIDHHDVCPEYAEDIKNAQKICREALEQIPAIAKLLELFPGQFNTAARKLFCKVDRDIFDFNTYIDSSDEDLDKKDARHIFGVTLAILLRPVGTPAIPESDMAVIDTAERSYEVCKVSAANDEPRAKYKAINEYLALSKKVEPCGSVAVRPIVIQTGWDNGPVAEVSVDCPEEIFILEEGLLQFLKVGMKMVLEICTLKCGIKFIKNIKEIFPTFHTFLPQELMFRYKEPVPNDRPAPSVYNPDDAAAEDVLNSIPIGDPEY